MRKIILQLAISLDGFIEGPNGEYDWCFTDQDYGLTHFFKRVDSLFIGRKSYEMMLAMGENNDFGFPKLKEYVFSTTLNGVKAGATLIGSDIKSEVEKIKRENGKDIWLVGGADLTASLMKLGLVDELSLAIHPILLGAGKSLFEGISERRHLSLIDTTKYSTGLVSVSYSIGKR